MFPIGSHRSLESQNSTYSSGMVSASAWYNLGVVYNIFNQSNNVTEVYRRLKILDSEMADKLFNEILMP